MKEKTTAKKRTLYYAILAISSLLLIAATVLTVYFVVSGNDHVLDSGNVPTQPNEPSEPSKPSEPDKPTTPVQPSEPSKPSDGEDAVRFTNPLAQVTLTCGYGFYHNQTLGWFYEHEGVDVAAEAGAQVMAMADGKVESIASDELTGTQITVDHGEGLKTVYRFVSAVETLSVGDSVEKGEVIATVSDAKGAEYKDGAHLHLEVWLNGANVDPTEYLTLSEK